ncbi:DUF1835 domain-containing protein [Desulfosporosinus fructosivorans]|nr:DUF1835 domain-containing protein [Desulfosporosinus fructosivorans]
MNMKEIIHICCSDSGRGGLKQAIKEDWIEGERVISFVDDLSNGPIQWIDDANSRIDWCLSTLSQEFKDIAEGVKSDYREFHEEIKRISNEEIYLWYARNGKEMCGLRYILSLLENKIGQIHTIDVSEKTFVIDQNHFTPRWVGEIAPKRFIELLPYKHLMTPDYYLQLIESWETLKAENAVLRIPNGTEVIGVSEDYLDDFILQYTETSFRKCARTVGEALGHSEIPVTDYFIFWRVLGMIKTKKILYRGKLGVMREMEIKRGSVSN